MTGSDNGGPDADGTPVEFEQVLDRELVDVRRRRHRHGLAAPPAVADSRDPSWNLIGLALSGGGIRSATFNLGVIQALHAWQALRAFDYLSTVSGGGFIGASLVNQLGRWRENLSVVAIDGTSAEAPQLDVCVADEMPHGSDAPGVLGLQLVARGSVSAHSRFRIDVSGSQAGDAPCLYAELVECEGPLEPDPEDPSVLVLREALTTGDVIHLSVRAPSPLDECFPMLHRQGQREGRAMRHLRRFSDYLLPDRFLASMRLPGVFIAGLIANAVMLLPLILLTSVLGYLFWGEEIKRALTVDKYQQVIGMSDVLGETRLQVDMDRFIPTATLHSEGAADGNCLIYDKALGALAPRGAAVDGANNDRDCFRTGWAVRLTGVPADVTLRLATAGTDNRGTAAGAPGAAGAGTTPTPVEDAQPAPGGSLRSTLLQPYLGNPGSWVAFVPASMSAAHAPHRLHLEFDVRGIQRGFTLGVHAWEHGWVGSPSAAAPADPALPAGDYSLGESLRHRLLSWLCDFRDGCGIEYNPIHPVDPLASLLQSSLLVVGLFAVVATVVMALFPVAQLLFHRWRGSAWKRGTSPRAG